MIRVKVSTSFPELPLARQTPGGSGIWGEHQFLINCPEEECDWWVLYEAPQRVETARCPPANVIFIGMEPPSLRWYPPRFLHQFATVVTCHPNIRHPDARLTHIAVPWHVGGFSGPAGRPMTYDDFQAGTPPKTKCLSVVSSNMTLTRGHRLRLRFVQELQRRLKDKVDIFGRGIRDIKDKWEAIAPYKYHIAIENSSVPHYWTEKLSDTYLGGAFPFYHGCPNIGDYFPRRSFIPIDIRDPDRAIRTIEAAIEDGTFEQSLPALAQAKERILNEYNLFPTLVRLIGERDATGRANGEPARVEIQPPLACESSIAGLLRRAARRLPGGIKRLLK
jgi:hypothetical protein